MKEIFWASPLALREGDKFGLIFDEGVIWFTFEGRHKHDMFEGLYDVVVLVIRKAEGSA